MKKVLKDFCIRGALFAWGGPVILAIVLYALHLAGTTDHITVNEAVLGILSTTVMAFIAAGVSIVYQMENLPKATAGLIQVAVLYVDYLGFYLLNGWLPADKILIFTAIFLAGFAAIWGGIYFSIRSKVAKMNRKLG